MAATLVGTETDSTADLTPRPSYTNLHFPLADNLEYNVDTPDVLDPFGALPPSSPPDYWNAFSDGESAAGLEIEQHGVGDSMDTGEEDNPCHGQQIEWVPGSIWETYAYAQHDSPSIPWTPIGFVGSKFIKIRSKSCRRALATSLEIEHQTCSRCSSLRNSEELKIFMKRATEVAVPRTNWIYLNACQLKEMLVRARKRAHVIEIKVCIQVTICTIFPARYVTSISYNI